LFNGLPDPRSCTEKVIRYFEEVLQPNGTALIIHTAWLYKAFWQFATREDDKCAVNQSKEGLRLLLEKGIILQDMQPHHWILLANMCNQPIPLSNLMTPARLRADRLTQEFITNLKDEIRAKEKKQTRSVATVDEANEEPETEPEHKRLRCIKEEEVVERIE